MKSVQDKEALRLFNRIPTGRNRALRGATRNRTFRQLVENANRSGKDLIINNGEGYFRPDIYDPGDIKELHQYLDRETGRANEMLGKVKVMRTTMEERIKGEIDGR